MRQFGLIGRTLSHSFSQTFFTQKFYSLGLAEHQYDLFELATIGELPGLLAAHPYLVGLNVTVPYKETVVPYLDDLAPSASRVGAVNVIERTATGRLVGHNTDYIGFRNSLLAFFPHRGEAARALVLGAGGAAKAVEVALQELGIPYWNVTRDPLGPGLTYDDITPQLLAAHPLIVNATPVGTFPNVDQCPRLPYEALTERHYLYDLVYNPMETLFMAKGKEAGAQVKNGFEMLCMQAEAAWDIWNAQPPKGS
ncbi:shikimate dehydrogenase [Hymenobacter sp. BT770]|uniref:shikimate dehydrogenase family protein n=1 Tax=Hymenobacter sp. BT770 TaxID=2886942 RepID=UPI001D111503|nr:shikimate dehydrogenase [Hymenobacter sp. BT770]MCC3151937.1 shikimate dehydrogenase [Hymenobacter sp. BT770]MDO3413440.1 shikimate dehydrogenase [Hymenobacter sp. BT770]